MTANSDPASTFKTNIKGTWNILEACRKSRNVKQVVISSSDKAYGDKDKLPYYEEDPLQGRHPYDVSKSCADLLAQAYHKTYNLPVCITRCANLYGGGDLNFSRIIPGTIRAVILGNRPVIRSNGKYTRDYFYVEDAVLALVTLAKKMQEGRICGEAFNFSSGINLSVIELVNKILGLMDKKIRPVILNKAEGEIRNQYLSIKKSKRLIEWEPRFSLEAGLKKTISWYRDYFIKQGAPDD